MTFVPCCIRTHTPAHLFSSKEWHMQRQHNPPRSSPGTCPEAPVSHNEARITMKTAGLKFFAIVWLLTFMFSCGNCRRRILLFFRKGHQITVVTGIRHPKPWHGLLARLVEFRRCPRNSPLEPARAESNSCSSTLTAFLRTASSSSSPEPRERNKAFWRNPPSTPARAEFGLHSQSLIEAKGFHAHDGTSISLARLGGIKTGLITKRISETVALRARDLRLEYVRQGIQDKRTCFEEVVKEEGIKLEEAAFVGDDVIDLPAMRASALAIAVSNARSEVKRAAVTPHGGGEGALRDAVEFILKAQGKWKKVLESYLGERSPKGSYSLLAKLAEIKNPSDACLGRARVSIRWATVSPYSPCCFQEYVS